MSKNFPATRRDDELILEGIVTTQREDGTTNISPMGPVVNRDFTYLRLRPFSTSSTYLNLRRHRWGVFHVTDDVDLLVRSALGISFHADLIPVPEFAGKYLSNACRWFAFEVRSIDDSSDRIEIECEIKKRGSVREFLGWNRASHAVLEATILATRLHLLSTNEVQAEFTRLEDIIHKTASQRERDAFRLVCNFVDESTKARIGEAAS